MEKKKKEVKEEDAMEEEERKITANTPMERDPHCELQGKRENLNAVFLLWDENDSQAPDSSPTSQKVLRAGWKSGQKSMLPISCHVHTHVCCVYLSMLCVWRSD